ncbi:MAG: monovalent cation/H(+) antiporter subunit G [Rhizobiaceae bacterium]|jgi:multicomponent Na+:H+ antiporter subunit G|nr:monovalent cation/H(+) antiporter subunit G [Rhizobiaceae bacterium]
MIDDLANYAAAALVIAGGFFALIGAIGLIRFPDLYSRSHAASKAGTVGSGLCMVAIALCTDDPATSLRAIAGVLFFVLTAPVAAHLLMRAAYKAGYPLWSGSIVDEMPRQIKHLP